MISSAGGSAIALRVDHTVEREVEESLRTRGSNQQVLHHRGNYQVRRIRLAPGDAVWVQCGWRGELGLLHWDAREVRGNSQVFCAPATHCFHNRDEFVTRIAQHVIDAQRNCLCGQPA